MGKEAETYHTASEGKENAENVESEHDYSAELVNEAGCDADEGDDEEPYSEEDFVIRDAGCAPVDLGCD